MNKACERLYNGLIKENPTFVLALGMCPTLAVTTSAINGLGMGLTTTVVLALSNLIISCLRKLIPNRVRIPAFIVIIATFVTCVQLLLEAYLPDLNTALGVYIPLIVVNCIILGRAESYAYTNPPIPSLFDGLGMGLGFSFALTCIGAFRELLGAGTIFDFAIMPDSYVPINIFILAPGAFFVLAALTAFQNYMKLSRQKAGKPVKEPVGCAHDCMNCGDIGCGQRFYDESQTTDSTTEAVDAEPRQEETVAEVTDEVVEEVSEELEALETTEMVTEEAEVPEENAEAVTEAEAVTADDVTEKEEIVAEEAPEMAESKEPEKKPAVKKTTGKKTGGARKTSGTKKNGGAKRTTKKEPLAEADMEIIDLDKEEK